MASKIKKAEGMSMIDCSMIVIEPEDGSDGIAFTSASKMGVEKQEETTDAVKNIIKGEVKAQKPEETTLTGHTLTLTDTTMIMTFLPILQLSLIHILGANLPSGRRKTSRKDYHGL